MPAAVSNKGAGATKKSTRSSAEDDSENLTTIDVKYNPDIINSHLQDIEDHVQSKCNQIQKDIDFMKTSLRQAFHLELIKIPTHVKQMSVHRFREEFGESLEAVTRDAISSSKCNPGNNIYSTGIKNKAGAKPAFQTPGHARSNADALRQPKEGERILSQNGSPLGVFNTIIKAPRTDGGGNIIPQTPGVYVPLQTGDVIGLDDVSSLPNDLKEEAIIKVQEMMNSMQSHLNKLKQSS
mmetsp:Transcript_33929/g.34566  ORF Transcript_33929/g.34566 Transcript_33929/m.34566 type:complete len:238 (+) Transcript_33929:112-825(+)|eukprot:CAMPEP_0182417088 /NCGR_PEP_ID=MMETSP1167-20130531/1503_1 /TAXON_ID=2988 /ORGANISM="Mallomonas Sp, Strain CCMP3275" /LENGTH=237 /DNA_ID=CAMNT_0024590381 /DNA_START=100 /DNA_END=813 /DNA_ORIENTATION=-